MNTATHAIAPEEIMALLDAELSAERAQFVTAHINECTECGDIANSLRNGSQTLAGWIIPAAPVHDRWKSSLYETARQIASQQNSLGSGRMGAFFRRHRLVIAISGVCGLLVLWSSSRQPMPARSPGVSLFSGNLEQMTDTQRQIFNPALAGRPLPKAPIAVVGGQPGRLTIDTGTALRSSGGGGESFSVDKPEAESQTSAGSRLEPSTPMIARTVSLSIVAKDFASSRVSLDTILARHHGYAASLTANTQQNAARSLQASLRIPATELNAAMSELKSLGHVQNETQGGEEVTQQHADLVARLKNSRETERRLRAILEQRTGKISDVLTVEQEIARVRGEIEQIEAEQKSLEHRVGFASIELMLAEEYKAQITPTSPATSTRIHNSLVSGYRDAMESLVGVALFFAEYGPTLLLWLFIIGPMVWLARRRWQRVADASSMSV
jgi:hypothetical protein